MEISYKVFQFWKGKRRRRKRKMRLWRVSGGRLVVSWAGWTLGEIVMDIRREFMFWLVGWL
jgi:hypothetical protein